MLDRYSQLVIRYRWPIVLLWIALGIGLPYWAPAWNSVTHDGDFAYLPSTAPTVLGQKLLDTAFETRPPKSQIVVGFVRKDAELEKEDFVAGYDIARRLINLYAARVLLDSELGHVESPSSPQANEQEKISRPQRALELLDQAIEMAKEMEALSSSAGNAEATHQSVQMLAVSYFLRAAFADQQAKTEEQHAEAAADLAQAHALDPSLKDRGAAELIRTLKVENFPIIDMWTWRTELVGKRLADPKKHCRLMVLHFPTEFMATSNIVMLERVELELDAVRDAMQDAPENSAQRRVELIVSGSAAVGSDMLRSSARSIRNTDWLTAVLVLIILIAVYRSPMMVAIPMAVIYLSLQISTSLLSILAAAAAEPNWPYWDFKIFATTRIFIVVLLYGAGTNACLFLISRFREECGKGSDSLIAVRKSVAGVGGALLASAAATILGLSMLYFAQFGKYHYTGPAIAFCLFVATVACLSLAPALLAVLGSLVFWPWPPLQQRRVEIAIAARRKKVRFLGWPMAEWVVRRPALVISIFLALMAAPALQGWVAVEKVNYDVLRSLGRGLPSRHGTDTLRSLFQEGEAGPIILLVSKPGLDSESAEDRAAISAFHKTVFTSQVASVRSALDPLGELENDLTAPLSNYKGLKANIARASRITRSVFVGHQGADTVLKWEVVPKQSPFSRESLETLADVEGRAQAFLANTDTSLRGGKLHLGGVTAAMRDLEKVTQADYRTVRWLVTLCVFGSLFLALRRPVVSFYIVATMLLGFFVTMGLTYWTFAITNVDAGYLLEWRVPLFLFVILVAVGSDYSVFLASRVFEEQATHGPFTGLRRGIEQTGGVISSCGIIMAGTFVSMTSGIWALGFPASWTWPQEVFGSPQDVQIGIVELGFALAMGILLDTFVVRTILLPAFLACLAHWKAKQILKRQKADMI